jgi:hypothetical protein
MQRSRYQSPARNKALAALLRPSSSPKWANGSIGGIRESGGLAAWLVIGCARRATLRYACATLRTRRPDPAARRRSAADDGAQPAIIGRDRLAEQRAPVILNAGIRNATVNARRLMSAMSR